MEPNIFEPFSLQRSQIYEMKPGEIKTKLRKLYLYYAFVGTRDKPNILTHPKLLKILKDSGITGQLMSLKETDIVVRSKTKTKATISFECFCEVLVEVAKVANRKKRKDLSSKYFYEFLDKFIFALYDQLKNKHEIENWENFDYLIENEAIAMLVAAKEPLTSLYCTFFPWETTSAETFERIAKRSQTALCEFANKYSITPDIINRSTLVKIWQDLVESQDEVSAVGLFACNDLGTVFTFKKFLLFLGRSACIGHFKRDNLSMAEKIVTLYENMELSEGFEFLQQKTNKTNTGKTSLLGCQKVVDYLSTTKSESKSPSTTTRSTSPFACLTGTHEAFEGYKSILQSIFTSYCVFGEPMNNKGITVNKFVKIMRDAGLLYQPSNKKGLKQFEFELVFKTVTRHRRKPEFSQTVRLGNPPEETSRMTFQLFLKALELLAEKLHPKLSIEQSISKLLEQNILDLSKGIQGVSKESIKACLDIINSENMQEIKEIWFSTLSPYANAYTDARGSVNLRSFLQFTKDFSVFPDLISKGKIVQIYSGILGLLRPEVNLVMSLSVCLSSVTKSKFLNAEELIQGTAVCALNSSLNYKTPEETLRVTLERMTQSKGPSMIPKLTGRVRTSQLEKSDNLVFLRKKFNYQNLTPEPCFEDLLHCKDNE